MSQSCLSCIFIHFFFHQESALFWNNLRLKLWSFGFTEFEWPKTTQVWCFGFLAMVLSDYERMIHSKSSPLKVLGNNTNFPKWLSCTFLYLIRLNGGLGKELGRDKFTNKFIKYRRSIINRKYFLLRFGLQLWSTQRVVDDAAQLV